MFQKNSEKREKHIAKTFTVTKLKELFLFIKLLLSKNVQAELKTWNQKLLGQKRKIKSCKMK